MPEDVYDCIIIGGGPAGYTAAIYAGRAALRTLVLAGYKSGGQLMITTDVEDYPGFPNGVQGPDLMKLWREQAAKFVESVKDVDVMSVDFSRRPFKVTVKDKTYLGRTVVIATGASARWLGLENEQRLIGKGVSSCAVCDGWFFKGKDIAVVGGGDTAMREVIYLSKMAKSVTVIHRRDELRAQKILAERANSLPNVKWVWNSVVEDVLGDEMVTGVKLKDTKTGETRKMELEGLFIAIGHRPNTGFLKDELELDEKGYIKIHLERGEVGTSVPGVFAAGDVHDTRYKQAVTAAAAGCKAALDAHRFLEETGESR